MISSASNDWVQQLYVQETTKKSPEPDFYKDENGNIVMSESYHIKRGSCCGNRCKNCPYEPLYQKGNKTFKKSLLS
jgi:hypothetical protein